VAEGRVRVQGLEDCPAHVVQVVEHVIIAHAEHAISVLSDDLLSYAIRLTRSIVACPINLDHQASGVAAEIDHQGANRPLTPEFPALEAAIAQCVPEITFGDGHFAPEVTGEFRR